MTLATSPAFVGMRDIATHGSFLYCADAKGLQRMAVSGGAVHTIVAGYNVSSVAVDATRVSYSDGRWLRSVNKTGGNPKVYAGGSTTVTAMRLHQGSAGSVIYWAEQNAAIRSVSTSGGYINLPEPDQRSAGVERVLRTVRVLWTDCAYPGASACAVRKRQGSITTSLSVGVGADNAQGDAGAMSGATRSSRSTSTDGERGGRDPCRGRCERAVSAFAP